MANLLFYVKTPDAGGIGGIDEYTKLMLHMDGDQSDSQHVVTLIGDPQFSTAESEFGGSSMRFDGISDNLSIPDHEDWDFESGNFTIDLWVRFNTVSINQGFIMSDDYSNGFEFYWTPTTGATLWVRGQTGFSQGSAAGWAINTWYHVALVRNGNNWNIYRDGVSIASTTNSYAMPNTSTPIFIGSGNNTGEFLNGYIDEFRITKGEARWTSNFPVPTSPYTSDSNTKLLLHMNGDVSGGAHVVTSNGNPQLNAATTKFDGAMYFDGSGDYLTAPDHEDWTLGSDSFTFDWWFFVGDLICPDGAYRFFEVHPQGTGVSAISISVNAAGKVGMSVSSNGSSWEVPPGGESAGGTIVANSKWYHVALVRDGSNWDIYVDGTSVHSATYAGSLFNGSGDGIQIGRSSYSSGSNYFKGYIDEFRFSNTARWTTDFTPETGPYTI